MYKNEITEREILKTSRALSVRVFISVLNEISYVFFRPVFGDFLRGFSVFNRPLRPPRQDDALKKTQSK